MKHIVAYAALAALVATQSVGAASAPPPGLALPDGSTARVDSIGIAQVWSPDHRTVTYRRLTPSLLGSNRVTANFVMPSKADALEQLEHASPRAYARGEVLVQFRPGVGTANQTFALPRAHLAEARTGRSVPQYTNDTQVNRAFAALGVDRTLRFAPNAYRVHLSGTSVSASIAALSKVSSVSYVSPNFYVSPMHSAPIAVPHDAVESARTASRTLAFPRRALQSGVEQHDVPTNYAVSASAQSMLNAPGMNAIGAYDEIARTFHQLPGQGEIITNVSLGDLTDASILPPPGGGGGGKGGAAPQGKGGGGGDPCAAFVQFNGPTTVVNGGQRYLNWPSMPLIPTYVSDSSGALSGSAEVCNSPDQLLGEVGLDFSVMAPLPHTLQRPDAQGAGFTDLLGIAPGASYRLVVPANPNPTVADIDAALLGAAMQTPRPNVITASLGFGFDGMGFPGRFLEEDPLTHAIVSSIVSQYNVVVCIAANDGLRVYTNAAVGSSGGSAATNVAPPGSPITDLNDVAFSTTPSSIYDSGAIDVGGTTLDDIFAAPPQDAQNAAFTAQHAFPVTRYDGMTAFSSGFGTRVNVSAPADNIPAMQHSHGGDAGTVDVYLEGGTSASAPEAAAAAAVALQVGRLTGRPFRDATAVRTFLAETAANVPNAPQADVALHVGPQIDLTNAVETLLKRAGTRVTPSVARVAIEQRRPLGLFGGAFISNTDPAAVDLSGPLDQNNLPTGNNQLAWITIAPDWEGISSDATFALAVPGARGHKAVLATTRWARLAPSAILRAAGLPLTSASSRTVTLTYRATDRGRVIETPVVLTFGPNNGTTSNALAPHVESVVRAKTIAVTYDLTNVRNVSNPLVIVSEPGRINPATGWIFSPTYTAPLPSLKGTAYVPVDRLQGDGIYGVTIGLRNDPNGGIDVSDFAYTHLLRALHDVHASAPLLSTGTQTPGHALEIPFDGSFTAAWDVSNVPGATGALLEISAPGPNGPASLNTFNNPNGSIRDDNHVDGGSVFATSVVGTRGSITLKGLAAHLIPTMNHVVRVIPMAGPIPAGEAGDVSTISMDGVLPLDGGILENGYAIDSHGNDAFLSSGSIGPNGFDSTIETFDQTTQKAQIASYSTTNLYGTSGSGVWGNDVGIASVEDLTIAGHPPSTTTYRLMNTVSGNTLGALWQPPVLGDSVSRIVQTAPNTDNGTALALAGDPLGSSTIPYQVFTSNLAANTFGPTYNINSALPSSASPFALGIAQDTSTQTGYVALGSFASECDAPPLASIDLTNGKIGSFNGPGSGLPLDIAIDSTTDKAVYQTTCDGSLDLVDLATHTGTVTPLPGAAGLYNAIDPVHHLIAVEMAALRGDYPNNNSMSVVFIYDEHGTLLKKLDRFNFYGIGLTINANNLQLNPGTRQGYMFGPGATQLEPFTY